MPAKRTMQWVESERARIVAEDLPPVLGVQTIHLTADTVRLPAEIPTSAELVPAEKGLLSPTYRWYGVLENRLAIVECEVMGASSTSSVLVQVAFEEAARPLGDWSLLPKLSCLPPSIFVSRPLWIESRNRDPHCVVYRPNACGWRDAIYKASSRAEADRLMAYLRQDPWNASCYIGEPDTPGTWVAEQDDGQVLRGTGADLGSAIEFACIGSSRYASKTYRVRETSGASDDVYTIQEGRIVHRCLPARSKN